MKIDMGSSERAMHAVAFFFREFGPATPTSLRFERGRSWISIDDLEFKQLGIGVKDIRECPATEYVPDSRHVREQLASGE